MRWRRGAVALVAVMWLGACGTSGEGEGAATTAPLRTTTEAPRSPTTTTTEPPTTTTTLDSVQVYEELNAEIKRACSEAVDSGKPAVPVFDQRWSEFSSPDALAATVQRCIEGELAARRPATTVAPVQPLVPQTTAPPVASSTYYENCDAARAAGAAPVHRGDPGYGSHLDRDNDGIGCE